MKNLLYYNLESTFVNDQIAVGGDGTHVSTIVDGVAWCKDTEHAFYNNQKDRDRDRLASMYLTFHIISSGTIVWKSSNASYQKTIEYSTDSGNTWMNNTSTTAGTPINVNAGDTVLFRGNNIQYANSSSYYNCFSGSTAKFSVEGNIMSLINRDNFKSITRLSSLYTFSRIFYYCTGLTSAENLILPATTLADYCYQYMFYGCTSLITAPELPAIALAYQCYDCMFYGCTSLTTAPELPATTLASSCYASMFEGCTSLTIAPELPATTLAVGCYNSMFEGCTSLNYIKCLATNISASDCTTSWVQNVASTGTFVKNPNMSSWTTGNNGIPTNWTVLPPTPVYDSIPLTFEILSPGTIYWKCYEALSQTAATATLEYNINDSGWTEIQSTKAGAPISVQAGDIVKFRTDNIARRDTSTFWTFSGTTAMLNIYGNIMSMVEGENYLNYNVLNGRLHYLFENMPGLISAENLIVSVTALTQYSGTFTNMFRDCISLVRAPKILSPTVLTSACYQQMFDGCTSLTAAPELPAQTLISDCYKMMFMGCTNLNYVKCLATSLSSAVSNYWLQGVSSTGTFVKNPSMTSWTTGANGIPTNWTVQDAS